MTAFAVATGLSLVVPGLGFAAALALGAAVAPPDPVASLAIGRRAGMPARLIALVEGEGLLNDGTALTIYGLAVTAAVGGGFSATESVGRFALAVVGGALCGLLVARALALALRYVDDILVENAASLATPFLAFALAETVEGSGVLAVVVAGLAVGHRRGPASSGESRLQTAAVWRIVQYLLEGYVFLLIGQQAPDVVRGLSSFDRGTVVATVAVTLAGVLGVRLLWLLSTRPRTIDDRALSLRDVTALWWAGTRGVITLATAFALPHDFPARDLLLFCAFVVVLVTLVGQGVTFAPLLRALGLRSGTDESAWLRAEAQAAAYDAAIERLAGLAVADDPSVAPAAARYRRMLEGQRDRLHAHLSRDDGTRRPAAPDRTADITVRHAMLEAQREELVRWRDAGRISDSDLHALERLLDARELSGM
ncbi:CPA1 family monovalent cation:H+ antiporter [Conexibacter arvalis]|uniref:CPA1 family monovalent cation:H+ antiporter n=1 Tax=Conexibacter arvalis TaxID=912552 RepID=A0A840IK25_9ACTN|nr:CPA1 family monovalent cation:H+ antiporter [Conexibacter arvalis]